MRIRRVLYGLLGAGCVCLPPRASAAADKAAVACIQSAEDGERARKAGELLHARELFARCAARECPAMLRRDCSSWIEDADRQIPSIVLGARDAQGHDVVDARASVDGALVREHLDGNAVALDPGSHVVRFEEVGMPPVEVQVVVRAGEKNRPILATLGPPAPPPVVAPVSPPPQTPVPAAPASESTGHVPAGAWVLGGVGIVAFGVFGTFGALGLNAANTLRSTCAPGCTDPQVQAVRAKLIVADTGLGIGVLSLVAAVWVGVHGRTRSQSAAGWDLVLAPSPKAASAGLVVRF